MDIKAYSFIWLSVSDNPSLYPQITSFKYKISENLLLPVQTGSAWVGKNFICLSEFTGLDYPSLALKGAILGL